jgi:hypothetical protein
LIYPLKMVIFYSFLYVYQRVLLEMDGFGWNLMQAPAVPGLRSLGPFVGENGHLRRGRSCGI